MSSLKVDSLSCKYEKEKYILNGISFSVNSGEAVAIVGPSGSGKTTLAYCLTGIIPNKVRCEVSGKILLDDSNILGEDMRKIVRRINVVMQNYEIQIFGLTVEEDIVFGLENLVLDENTISERLEWALSSFGLEKHRNQYVSKLSGGLKQKLAIASTIVMQPDFLVMDDPTSNLDWKGIKDLRNTINQLKEQGKGIIIMARRLKGLEGCVDKVYRLSNGAIEEYNYEKDFWKVSYAESKAIVNKEKSSVKIEDLWFRYSQDYILRGINLEFHPNEIVAIMGPNGSGKTTLVKHINGLLKPVKGKVIVMGKDTKNHTAAELSRFVGFVFQDPDRHITFESVWDEVTFGCKNLGLPFKQAEEALMALNLYDKKEKPPYYLSMGEKVRLTIASALAMNPGVLVLDEPTTGQDEKTLRAIEKIVRKMREEGKSVLIVTHDSDFALRVSDRAVVINDGLVVADSHPVNILLNDEMIEKFELEPPAALLSEVGA